MGVMIEVENIGKQYRLGGLERLYAGFRERLVQTVISPFKKQDKKEEETFWALKDVSLAVEEGEILGIIGPNGAGKSTLLKILSRITTPTEGKVKMYGRVGSLLEVGTGFHPELTGRENIYLNGAVLGMSRKEINKKFDEIVEFSGLEKFLNTPVKYYSSGMYVRLGFAVAAHLEPEILLVDEVLAVGDAAFRKKCLDKMGEVTRAGRTVIFVSHNMEAIKGLCKRVVFLNESRVEKLGNAAEVVTYYIEEVLGNLSGNEPVRYPVDDPDVQCRITEIKVLNSGNKPSLIHDISEPVRVEVSYEVRKPFDNLVLAFILYTAGGTVLLTSNETDWKAFRNMQSQEANPKHPGKYKGWFQIPAPLLLPGRYELYVSLYDNPTEYQAERGFILEIIDKAGFLSTYQHIKKIGILSVPIQWHIENDGRQSPELNGSSPECVE